MKYVGLRATLILGRFCLFFHGLEESPESLHTNDERFLKTVLLINDVHMLKDLMGLFMNDVHFSVIKFFHHVNSYPTKEVGIIFEFDVFFFGVVTHNSSM